ncbi:MAG: hypothetical protein IT464_11785 [Planctomycetes bacterium]|nr:hypothetical protein [Planctomycetota bacterium]
MRQFHVVMNGQRKGPYKQEQIVAAIKAGKLPEAAEIVEVGSGEIVLPDELLSPMDSQKIVDVAKISDSLPGDRRQQGSKYTQGASEQAANWGAELYGNQAPPPVRSDRERAPGILSFVLAFLCPIFGVIGGIFDLRRARREGLSTGWAWAAIIIGSMNMIGGAFVSAPLVRSGG